MWLGWCVVVLVLDREGVCLCVLIGYVSVSVCVHVVCVSVDYYCCTSILYMNLRYICL